MAAVDRRTPVVTSADHAAELVEDLALGAAGVIDVDRIAGARPSWPIWPQLALDELVGPPGVRLPSLDLRWLHRFQAVVGVLDSLVAAVGGPVGGPSAVSLLTERARMLGHTGWGGWSAGTSCRLVRCGDGWLAVNLPREEDLDAVPALLGQDPSGDAWSQLVAGVADRPGRDVVETAALLGVPVAVVPVAWELDAQRESRGAGSRARGVRVSEDRPRDWPDAPTVVDLTSLWAGPLAGNYLARAGARVVKVESIHSPDGARAGTPAFWRHLNGKKELVEIDFRTVDGRAELAELVADADVVIESSRPRALEALGIDAAAEVARGCTWCSITGYGRAGPWRHRVAFGDDAAAAGGLVTFVGDEPWFIG
ncbi:MAG: CoA transferase, partial [Actinomycetota bacterium]